MIRRSLAKKILILLILLTIVSSIFTLPIWIMQIVWSYLGFGDNSSQISMNVLSCTTFQLIKYIYSKELFGITFIAVLVNYVCEILLFILFLIMAIMVFINSKNTSEEINPDEEEETLFRFPRIILFYSSYIIASLNILACSIHFGYYIGFYIQITDNCSASDFKTHYIVLFSLMLLVWIIAIIIWILLFIIALLSRPDQIEQKAQTRKDLLIKRRQENQLVKRQLVDNRQIQLTRNNLNSPKNEYLQTHNALAPKSKEQSPRKTLVDDRYIVLRQQENNKKSIEQENKIYKRTEHESHYYQRNFQKYAQKEKSTIKHSTFENRRNIYDKPTPQHFKTNQSQQNQQLRNLRPKRTAVPPLAFEENKSKVNPTPKFYQNDVPNEIKIHSPKKREKYEQNYFDSYPHHHHDQKGFNVGEGNLHQPQSPSKKIHSSYFKEDEDFSKSKQNKKDRKGMMIDYIRGKYAD